MKRALGAIAFVIVVALAGAVLAAEASRARAEDLYEVIVQRMDLVMFELGDNDDPQVIFEALNGRGTPLLPSDLIKNRSLA